MTLGGSWQCIPSQPTGTDICNEDGDFETRCDLSNGRLPEEIAAVSDQLRKNSGNFTKSFVRSKKTLNFQEKSLTVTIQ